MSPESSRRVADVLTLIRHAPSLIRSIDLVIALDEFGSQKAVAIKRNLPTSTVSDDFRRLEDALGWDVGQLRQEILRGNAGEFVAAARQVLASCDLLIRAAELIGDTKVVRVGCFNHSLKNYLADAVADFAATSSQYEILLPAQMGGFRFVHPSELLHELSQGLTQYAIVPLASHQEVGALAGYQSVKIHDFYVVAVVSDDHPLRDKATVQAHDLRERQEQHGEQFVVGPPGFASRETLFRLLDTRATIPNILQTNPDTNTRVRIAQAGLGIALAHTDAIDAHAADRPYPVLMQSGELLGGSAHLTWLEHPPMESAEHNMFQRVLRNRAKKHWAGEE